MNEFKQMIKEAFVGEEAYDPAQGREALVDSIRRFESRDRTLRWMMWFAVTFMTVLSVWAAWQFWASDPDASAKSLILYAVIFLWGCQGIGWAKMFLFSSQLGFSLMKELKRLRLETHANSADR